jgi:hypothetical protein
MAGPFLHYRNAVRVFAAAASLIRYNLADFRHFFGHRFFGG